MIVDHNALFWICRRTGLGMLSHLFVDAKRHRMRHTRLVSRLHATEHIGFGIALDSKTGTRTSPAGQFVDSDLVVPERFLFLLFICRFFVLRPDERGILLDRKS